MKKFTKTAIVMLMLTAIVFAVAACNTVSGISIEQANMPRLVFVQGQDIDLSQGKLTVKRKNETEEVALDSADVSVTGYDKNKLGEQKITIKYQGKTTELTVTVVARIVVEGIESNYFVGESFNTGKGRLKITNDDGSSFNVNINDKDVTLEGFDSTAAATNKSVTAHYKDYAGTFAVNIYNIDDITLTKPKKANYKSHERDMDLAGGYLTLKGNNGTFTRSVPLNASMAKGFDPSAATIENETTPLEQTVTFSYANRDFEFKINITYSDVSKIKSTAGELASLDWTTEKLPSISIEQGKKALAVLKLYLDLSDDDKTFITEKERLDVLRPATIYIYSLWADAAESFQNTFYVKNNTIYFPAQTYQGTKADIERLKDENNELFVNAKLLLTIEEQFGKDILINDVTLSSFLSAVYNPDNLKDYIPVLEYMITLYDSLNVPKDWTAAGLENYKTEIAAAFDLITKSAVSAKYRFACQCVSSWREKNDFIDIIYTYYFGKNDEESLNALKEICLPGQLEDIYNEVVSAYNQVGGMQNGKVYDTTNFLLAYRKAMTLKEEVANGSNEMYKQLYANLAFDGFLVDADKKPMAATFDELLITLKRTTGGYFYHNSALLGDDIFTVFLNQYLDLIENNMNGIYETDDEFLTDFDKLFADFIKLSPSRQLGFLTTLNTYYRQGTPVLSFDISQGAYNYFAYLTINRFASVLKGDSFQIFYNLLISLECNAHAQTNSAYHDLFMKNMDEIMATYEVLDANDLITFNKYAGDFYNYYAGLYDRYKKGTTTELGDWAATFEELSNTLLQTNYAYRLISNKVPAYSILIAASEKAEILVKKILAEAPADIIEAFYNQDYPIFSDQSMPLDYAWYFFRNFYISLLTSNGYDSTRCLWDYYEAAPELRAFYSDASYLMGTYIMTPEDEKYNFDADKVMGILTSFRTLSLEDQMFFLLLDNATSIYRVSIVAFLNELLPENAAKAAAKIFDFEWIYILYKNNPDGKFSDTEETYLETLKKSMAELVALHDALTGDDLTAFEQKFKEVYEYYLAEYQKLELPAETEATAA